MNANILGLSGFAGAGKDIVADMLVRRGGWVKVSLADPLKRICKDVFAFSDEQLWGPSDKRNAPDKRYPRSSAPVFPTPVLGAVWFPLSRDYALIDLSDFDRVTRVGPWSLVKKEAGKKTQYAKTSINGVDTKLHHFILGKVIEIDHINGNGLDNRKINLRETNASLNHANMRPRTGGSSPFKGVSFDSHRKKWSAKIVVQYKTVNLGRFDCELDAAIAYDEAAKRYFGEHARINADCFLTPRYALQQLGTEYGRNCYHNVWIDYALCTAKEILDGGYVYTPQGGLVSEYNHPMCPKMPYIGVVIPDVRFRNEMDAIRAAGGKLVRISRSVAGLPGAAGQHASETEQASVDDDFFDHILRNDSDLGALQSRVNEMLP